MTFYLINEKKKDRRLIKTSFDWPAFFSPWIIGVPHFLRGQTNIGVIFVVLTLISWLPFLGNFSEEEIGFMSLFMLVFFIGLSIYMGLNGRKLLAKHLLQDGYSFENEKLEVVTHYKNKWGML
jgi:hypothetical protein